MNKFHRLARDHAQWSYGTFGLRGPTGSIKHMALEVRECLDSPFDLEEYADVLLLLLDASCRAGYTSKQLLDAAYDKLAVNKKRKWVSTSPQEPARHETEGPPGDTTKEPEVKTRPFHCVCSLATDPPLASRPESRLFEVRSPGD